MRRPKLLARIPDALRRGPMTSVQIAEALGSTPRGIEKSIHQLARFGAIKCVGKQLHGRKVWGLAA